MPTTTALAPLTHPDSGKPVAAGDEITLSQEDYEALRADGKVAASAAETKANQVTANPEGVYNARVTRGDAPAAPEPRQPKRPEQSEQRPEQPEQKLPGPSAPTEEKKK